MDPSRSRIGFKMIPNGPIDDPVGILVETEIVSRWVQGDLSMVQGGSKGDPNKTRRVSIWVHVDPSLIQEGSR